MLLNISLVIVAFIFHVRVWSSQDGCALTQRAGWCFHLSILCNMCSSELLEAGSGAGMLFLMADVIAQAAYLHGL